MIRIEVDGKPVTGLFMSRLISATVTDKEGTKSDTIELDLDAGPPFLAVPRKKAIITCWMGDPLQYMGRFAADDITLHCLPYRITVTGKAADMRATLKEHRERHWDDASVGAIVGDLARDHGLTAQISGKAAAHTYPWFGQQSESALNVLQRLADRHDALFTIKDGKLIWGDRGAGQSPSGRDLAELVLTPAMIIEGTCSVTWSERPKHKAVKAHYHDQRTGQQRTVEEPAHRDAGGNTEAEAAYVLRHAHADEAEARRAAKSVAGDLGRRAETTEVTIEGNASARGGGPMSYREVHPEVDGRKFVIETATHRYAKSGFTTQISAKTKV